jgi:hypothetical protein
VALREARISVQPLWGFSSSNPHHSQSRAEQIQPKKLVLQQGKVPVHALPSRFL